MVIHTEDESDDDDEEYTCPDCEERERVDNLLTTLLVRVQAIESLLIDKKIITERAHHSRIDKIVKAMNDEMEKYAEERAIEEAEAEMAENMKNKLLD